MKFNGWLKLFIVLAWLMVLAILAGDARLASYTDMAQNTITTIKNVLIVFVSVGGVISFLASARSSKKSVDKKKIIVERRTDDYMAFLEGRRDMWGCGQSIDSAVGSLISSHRDQFSIEITAH